MSEFDLRRPELQSPFGMPGVGPPQAGRPPVPQAQTAPTPQGASPTGGTPQGLPASPMGVPAPGTAEVPLGPDGKPDLVGESDRGLARAQLAGKFQVMPADYTGPRNHNQVTAEEYERIVKTYSDIRLGRGDLGIESSEMAGTPKEAQYRSGVMDNIAMMMQTTAGRNQIYGMHDNVLKDDQGKPRNPDGTPAAPGQEVHRHTSIRALHQDANGDGNRTNDPQAPLDNTNAFADIANQTGTAQDGAVRQSQWFRQWNDPTDKSKGHRRGSGGDVDVFFNPMTVYNEGNAVRPDVVLAHELEHARHESQGTMASGTVDAGAHYSDSLHRVANSEHQAVGLGHFPGDADGCTENTYRQQRNDLGDNLPLRSSYRAQHPMAAAPRSTSPVPTSAPTETTARVPATSPVPTSAPTETTARMPAAPTPAAPAPRPTTPSDRPVPRATAQETTQRLPAAA